MSEWLKGFIVGWCSAVIGFVIGVILIILVR